MDVPPDRSRSGGILAEGSPPAYPTGPRSETGQGCGMAGFRDREARRHSIRYVEGFDRVKAGQDVPLDRRSRGPVG